MEIIEYKEIDSTNDELRRLAENGAANFTVVTAKKQTRGKDHRHDPPPGRQRVTAR